MANVAQITTKPTASSVDAFINKLADEQQRKDSFVLLTLLERASKEKPKMWGTSMVGFGIKRYKSPATGREVDWFKIGFSPRKANISLHLVSDLRKHAAALERLGKHNAGVGCIYIKTPDDIDLKVLKGLIEASLKRN
jgi:hypothetical protein